MKKAFIPSTYCPRFTARAETRSRSRDGKEIRVDICSARHPFLHGQAEVRGYRRPRRAVPEEFGGDYFAKDKAKPAKAGK